MDKETSKPWTRPWTTDEIRENSPNWNLAGDSGLLNHLQQFSQNLLAQTHATEVALDKLVEDVKTTATNVQNATNTFLFLANTQFVENRVYDDDEKETPPEEKKDDIKPSKAKEEQEAEVFQNVKQALDIGLALLETHFEAVEVPASDSEEEESSASVGRLVLKPKNPYLSRPLPYLIGSREFMEDDKVGLGDISSDTEESPDQNIVQSSESDDEMENELVVTPKRRMTLSSSDTENSEPESDRSETINKQKKLRTGSTVRTSGGGEEEEEEEGDMFGQESPPEADEATAAKGASKSGFADELTSKLGSAKPQTMPERRRDKDNLFMPSSEPEDDSALFGKESHSFSENQGLFDDLDDWQTTSNSLWKNNVSSSKPAADLSNEKTNKTGNVSSSPHNNKLEDDVFPSTKPKIATLNVAENGGMSTSTPESDVTSRPKESDLFGQKNVGDDLFIKKPKDSIAASSSSALFGNDDLQDDDLFAVPSQPSTSQNSKKKKLPGAVPVFSDVSIFGNISPVIQHESTVGNQSARENVQSSGSGLPQEASSGIGSTVYHSSEKDEIMSQGGDKAANETSSLFDSQNIVTSTKLLDEVSGKSLFKEEEDSDSLFNKPRYSDQNVSILNRNILGSKLSTSSTFKTKTKKTVSLFDDSDSGDDELLFSSTSSTSSRSRRSQGSGDILAGAMEKKTLPKKTLFEDNVLFGSGSRSEPEVDIFKPQSESKAKRGSLSQSHIFDANDIVSDSSAGSKKTSLGIFDNIDEVDDIFAVPKITVEKAQVHPDSNMPTNAGKFSLFSDDTGDKSDIFSSNFQENKETKGIDSVPEESNKTNVFGAPSIVDTSTSLISGDISSLPTKDPPSISKTEIKEKVTKKTKPSVSQKPKVPIKPTPSCAALQKNLQESNVPKIDNKVEDSQNVIDSETRTQDIVTVISVPANNDTCKSGSALEVEKVGGNQTSSVSSKPEPPRTLNIRKTTEIVFESPSNEDDDLFESSWSEKSLGKESIHQKQPNNSRLSSSNFSKLLDGFSSTSPVTSSSTMSREESSNSSSVSSKTHFNSDLSDVQSVHTTGPLNNTSPSKLRIDPRTLLPGAKHPRMKATADKAVDFDKPAETTSMLHSAGKERVKIQVKRRPQTRRARQEALRASSVEYDTIDAALISQISNNKNNSSCAVSSSASSNSPVKTKTPKVFEPGNVNKSSIVEKSANDVYEKSPKNNSEGQSSISESDQLVVKSDMYKHMLSDGLSGNSNPLSPLTDEEDIFAVPNELPFDETNKEVSNDSKNIFGGAPVLSPLDLPTEGDDFNNHSVLQTTEEEEDNAFMSRKKDTSIHTTLDDKLKSNDLFQEDAPVSHVPSTHVSSDKSSCDNISSVSNTENMFEKPSDNTWLDPGHLESQMQRRGLFDGDNLVKDNEDEDDDDLFSTGKKFGKKGEKVTFHGFTPQTSLFSPDATNNLESIVKGLQIKKSSEEFYSSANSPQDKLTQRDPEIKSAASKIISGEQGSNDDNSVLFPQRMSDSSQRKEIDDLFASNISAKDKKTTSSVKIMDKVKQSTQQDKVKSHIDSLFGDDSTESDDLFGSSSVPKKIVAGSSSNSALGSKLRDTKESLFDDGDDDDIFTLGLNKNKGPKSDVLFSKEENPIQSVEDADDLFSKKDSNSRNQGTKPSSAQKVQSFEDPLMVFNK